MQTSVEAIQAVNSAKKAYDFGRGTWPRMTPNQRIQYVQEYLVELKVNVLHLIQFIIRQLSH